MSPLKDCVRWRMRNRVCFQQPAHVVQFELRWSTREMADISLFIASVVNLFSLCTSSWQLLTIYDIQSDYVNTVQGAQRLNYWIQFILGFLFLQIVFLILASESVLALATVGILSWIGFRFAKKPADHEGIYETTTLRQLPTIRRARNETLARVVFHSVMLFLLMYRMTSHLA